jgi:hypothetical protein
MLKPLFIYYSENPRLLKGYNKTHFLTVLRSNKKSLDDGTLVPEFSHILLLSLYCRNVRKEISATGLACFDNASGYPGDTKN